MVIVTAKEVIAKEKRKKNKVWTTDEVKTRWTKERTLKVGTV